METYCVHLHRPANVLNPYTKPDTILTRLANISQLPDCSRTRPTIISTFRLFLPSRPETKCRPTPEQKHQQPREWVRLPRCRCAEKLSGKHRSCDISNCGDRLKGCVNPASSLPLAAGCEVTQPRDHLLAYPCASLLFFYQTHRLH